MTNVTITGTPRAGYTLTAVVDPATTGTFEWEGAGVASGNTYVVAEADAGTNVRLDFTFLVNGVEDKKGANIDILPLEENKPHGDFDLSGKLRAGKTLGIDDGNGAWKRVEQRDNFTASAKTYQWMKDGAAITGETGPTYDVTAAEEDAQIQLRIDYVDGLGNPKYVLSEAAED